MTDDAATRQARIAAHNAFDSLWVFGGMTRTEAYRWLRDTLGLSARKCHIRLMGAAMCQRVIDEVNKRSRP